MPVVVSHGESWWNKSGPLQNRPRFETEPLLRRILGIEVSPTYHAWARGGCGTHSNSWRSNTARLTIHVQSRTMRGRVQCMHACMQGGWIDCGRWENIESRLACVIVLKVLGEWEKCFSLVWNLLTVETETSRWRSSSVRSVWKKYVWKGMDGKSFSPMICS